MQHDLLADQLAGVLGAQQLAHGQVRAAAGRILAPVRAMQRDGLACARTRVCRLRTNTVQGRLRATFNPAGLKTAQASEDVLTVGSRPGVMSRACAIPGLQDAHLPHGLNIRLAPQGGWQGRRTPVAHAGLKPLYLEYSSNQ